MLGERTIKVLFLLGWTENTVDLHRGTDGSMTSYHREKNARKTSSATDLNTYIYNGPGRLSTMTTRVPYFDPATMEKNASRDSAVIGEEAFSVGHARGDEAELARMGYKQELKYVICRLFAFGRL
jgi:hypothetical protein